MADRKKRRFRDRVSSPSTLIGEGCRIAGTISGTGNFMISGEVEGDCELNGTVSIARSGTWRGILKADAVMVAGTVDGDIEARGRVEITNSARITGTVSGEAIAVAEGAVVEGVMKTTGRKQPVEFVEKRETDGDD